MDAVAAIEHLVGLQAQAPFAPCYRLWSRLEGFPGDELSGLLSERRVVRIV
jgi:Winged helix DNA-binding domain